MRLVLRAGMNLVAYPFSVASEHARCRQFLNALGGTGNDELQRIDPVTQRIEHCGVDAGEDFAILPGVGYIAMLGQADKVILEGDTQCPTIALQPGINLASLMMPDPELSCYIWIELLEPKGITLIQELDPQRGWFRSCAPPERAATATPSATTSRSFPVSAICCTAERWGHCRSPTARCWSHRHCLCRSSVEESGVGPS